jgi:hypothetical protein
MTKAHEVASGFPHLRQRLDTAAAENYLAEPDDTFEFGLHTILAGFEARLSL